MLLYSCKLGSTECIVVLKLCSFGDCALGSRDEMELSCWWEQNRAIRTNQIEEKIVISKKITKGEDGWEQEEDSKNFHSCSMQIQRRVPTALKDRVLGVAKGEKSKCAQELEGMRSRQGRTPFD